MAFAEAKKGTSDGVFLSFFTPAFFVSTITWCNDDVMTVIASAKFKELSSANAMNRAWRYAVTPSVL
jgi:hypothetical protein